MNIKRLLMALAFVLTPFVVMAGTLKVDAILPVYKIDQGCSAVAIKINKDVRLLTAAHCTKGNTEGYLDIETRDEDFKMISIDRRFYEVLKSDVAVDLALLKIRDPLFVPVTASIAEKVLVDEGDDVWTVGYPLGATRTVTKGLFNGFQIDQFRSTSFIDMFRASPNIDGGNSGGGLFQKNEDKYELIGITSMKYNANNHMGLYVTLDDIHKFVRFVKVDNTHKLDAR